MAFKRSWRDVDAWECSECRAALEHLDDAPYNKNQVTCSEACARARKTRLQKERRADLAVPVESLEPTWDRVEGRWRHARSFLCGYVDWLNRPAGGWPPRRRGERAERARSFLGFSKRTRVYLVPPARLEGSGWGNDEGDIVAAYSAQSISETRPGQTPRAWAFEHDGARWVNTGSCSMGPFRYYVHAYRAVPERSGRSTRSRKKRFGYAGLRVSIGAETCVLTSEAAFLPDNAPRSVRGTTWARAEAR